MNSTEMILTNLVKEIIENNKRAIGQSIEDFNNVLDRDPELALKNLSMLSKEDQQTPPVIIEKMIDSAGWRLQNKKIDTTKIYLDPCCGRGGILAYLHTHYNVSKENLYGIDIKQENITLCTKLGFNVIKGNALDKQAYVEIANKIKEIKGDNNMKIDRVLMNPPYDGSLHLEILNSVLVNIKAAGAEVVSIQPARWVEDPLAKYKQGTDYKKYKDSIVNKISKLQLIDQDTASKLFNIMANQDLAIYTFGTAYFNLDGQVISTVATSCINKILSKLQKTINDVAEQNKLDGFRCEIHKLLPTATGARGGDSISAKTNAVKLVNLSSNSVFNNGYANGVFWTEDGRAKNGSSKPVGAGLPYSIKANTEQEALNIEASLRTNFYKNLILMFKYDQNMPLRFLPYMEDYSHVWTDEDYCKFFDLTEEESEFMCRKVDDYRVKDFINYIKLDEE